MKIYRNSKGSIYKLLFFLLLFLNGCIGLFIVIKYPRVLSIFEKKVESFFETNTIPVGNYLNGIDVSEYQGIINWKTVFKSESNDSIAFVFIRATAGKNHRDRFFTSNYREVKKANIRAGAYHYYRPNESSTDQAQFFIKNVKLSPGDLPPILDIEKTSDVQSVSKLKEGIKNWLTIIENHYGVQPILYTYSNFYNSYLKNDFSNYTLWIANYNSVDNPLPSSNWQFWQYSEQGAIQGIKGPVDLNVFKNDNINLESLLLK